MRIATMGIDYLDPDKFTSSGGMELNKPNFGLYGSTLIRDKLTPHGRCSWLNFVYDNDFLVDTYRKGISYTLHKNTKIYTVDGEEDYLSLLDKYGILELDPIDRPKLSINFDMLKKDYDAFHLTEKAFWDLRMYALKAKPNKYRIADFYDYDCETWIIFNLECINIGSIQNVDLSISYKDYITDDEEDD